jgi:hypothetical protein
MAAFSDVRDGEIVAARLYDDTACLRAQLGGPDRQSTIVHPSAKGPGRKLARR